MSDRTRGRGRPRPGSLILVSVWLWWATGAAAQTPPAPVPVPTSPPVAPVPSGSREAELEERVRQLEAMVKGLTQQVQSLSQPQPAAGASAPGAPAGAPVAGGPAGSNAGASEEVQGGSAEPAETFAQPTSRFNMPGPVPDLKAQTRFGPGFEIRTPDDEYSFQFHDLTQFDFRGYEDTPIADPNVDRYQSTFGFPRQWWIFSGRLTKPFEYYVVPAFGFDNVNLLDAFLNIRYDDRLQLKIGRYKTPFTYEFYNLPINALVSPERSLFFNNFGLNRDCGIMAWGALWQKRMDYAVGIFNGDRNFFIDRNSSKDVAALINFKPFVTWEDSPLENLNIGGSVLFGNEFNKPIPQTLRTNVATTGASFFGVPFLSFNNNVVESGDHALWDLHAAWYYRHLSLIGEWGSGFQNYAFSTGPGMTGPRTALPVTGYYAQAGYFITGETVSARGMVKPLRDFDIRKGKVGPGAIELTGRWSTLNLGNQVFTSGLADPNLWTNSAYLVDVGVNWYLTQYIKVYLGWQHAMFGSPVLLDPNRFQLTNDMYWARFQIYF